jgi:WD40 repeat protein
MNSPAKGSRIHEHPFESKIAYPSGDYIIVRSIIDPSDSYLYRGHKSPTTCVKFSPNGCWIASGDQTGIIRIWSWSDSEHLTKLETKMFTGAITHVDWDAESKTILALGDGGDANSVAKSLNFDSNVHTSPKGSPYPESHNLFLSSLSQREKLTMSISNEKTKTADQEVGSNQAGFTPGAKQASFLSPIRVENSFIPVPSSSSKQYQEQNMKSPPSSPIPPPPIYLPKDTQPFSPNGTKTTTPTSSSGSVLDRLRAVEGHIPIQLQHNTVYEAKLIDIDGEFAKFNVDVSVSLQDLQQRFERDIRMVHRESENR